MKKTDPIRWLLPLLELVLPERCRVCKAHLSAGSPAAICRECLAEVEYLGASVCRRCGGVMRSRVAGGQLCGECIRTPPPWDQAISVVKYGPVVRELLCRLKYNADTTVLPALATMVQPVVDSVDRQYSYIIPVPLHFRRLQSRGMNQAVYLAQILFPARQQRITTTLLQRNKPTCPQTGLDGAARRQNLQQAFQLSDSDAVRGECVCIVDDVFTTGTTVAECSRVLRQAGAIEIKVITLARVVIGE